MTQPSAPESIPNTPPETTPAGPRRSRTVVIAAAVVALAGAAGLAGIYGIGAGKARGDLQCTGAVDAARRAAPFARGEVAAVSLAETGRRLPDLAFTDAKGQQRTLSEWRGKTVLLNLWATWCVPCRTEMPALDALAGAFGTPDKTGPGAFDVVAVNIDTRDLDKPKTWLEEIGVRHLAYYADPQVKIFQDLKAIGRAFGMPTTLLVDPQGCEIGYLAGPAEWASADAKALIRAVLGEDTSATTGQTPER